MRGVLLLNFLTKIFGDFHRPLRRAVVYVAMKETTMSLGMILLIVLAIALLGGFSGVVGGYGYGFGHGGVGVLGTVLIVVLVLVLLGRL